MARAHVVIPELVRMFVRSRAEYPGAMVLGWVSQMASYGAMYTAIALIIVRFGTLGGWTWSEMALVLSFHLLAYSMGAAFSFTQFRIMEDLVRMGTMDTILVKPISPMLYLVFSGINIGYAGHIVLAIGLMAWALSAVEIAWSFPAMLFFIGTLLSGALIVFSVMMMIGATALIWVRSRHLYSIFFGFWELARYPMNIFPMPIQLMLVTIMPLGFMSTIPVAALLGKDVPLLSDWAGPASLLAGPLVGLIALAHWRYCLDRYQGAGG